MKNRQIFGGVLAAAALLGVARVSLGDDWAQFRGPARDGVSKEKGLLKAWPEGGPKLLWKVAERGEGHATPSVARGKIFGMGLRADGEYVWVLDEKTGKELWAVKIADGVELQARQGGNGSRSTPTIDGNVLYTLGVGGEMVCLNVADGKLVWRRSLTKEFGGQVPVWGYSESPLLDGEKVIVTPGGPDAAVVALNKKSGATIWKATIPDGGRVSYSSALAVDFEGKRQIVQFMAQGVAGLSAVDGKLLWRYNSPANRQGISCSMPLFKDGYVFAATSYQTGGGLAKLSSKDGVVSADEVYFTKEMRNHHGGMVLLGDYLYGFDESNLTCLEFKTGKVMWANRSVGKGSVTLVDGLLYCRSERGPIALVEATPTGYVEKGRFEQPDRSREPSWPYPVIANGRLIVRDQNTLLCYEVK